jgi:hypothetical protein
MEVNVMVLPIRHLGAASRAALASAAVGAFITLAACGSQVAAVQTASTHSPATPPKRGAGPVAGVALCRDIPRLTSVVITHTTAFRAFQKGSILPRGITILAPGQVRDLATALCELPKMPPGPVTCPAEFGSSVRFGFAARGRPFPPVTVQASGCRVVTGLGPARTASSAAFWRTLSEDLALSSSQSTSRSGGMNP